MILLHAPLNGNRVGRFAAAMLSALLFWAAPLLFSAGSLSAAPPAPPEGKRFLFIIDTSASMKPMEDPLSEALFDLVYSGVRGKMTNGDSYGVWLVNEQNDTSFKMAIWKERYAVEMAAKAVKHVKDKGFRGKFRLDAAIVDAAAVIRNVEDLTVILISNGETPIVGTPFDDIINVRFRELAPHMQRAEVTLNTALVAQGGQIVAWAANTPEFLIEIPYVAPRPKPAPTTETTSNVAKGPSADRSQPAPPRLASNPIIITRETVAKEKRFYQALASTASSEADDAAIESTNGPSVIASNAPATNSLAVLVDAETNASATASAPAIETNAAVAVESARISIVSKSETVQLPPTTGSAAEPQPASRISSPLVWAGAGAGAALLCVIAGFLLARSRRSHPSLISQSISQQRITAA